MSTYSKYMKDDNGTVILKINNLKPNREYRVYAEDVTPVYPRYFIMKDECGREQFIWRFDHAEHEGVAIALKDGNESSSVYTLKELENSGREISREEAEERISLTSANSRPSDLDTCFWTWNSTDGRYVSPHHPALKIDDNVIDQYDCCPQCGNEVELEQVKKPPMDSDQFHIVKLLAESRIRDMNLYFREGYMYKAEICRKEVISYLNEIDLGGKLKEIKND